LVIDDAYAELGLSPGANEAEVKAAWRRLVSKWHPDRNRTDSAIGRMQRINTAYERIRLAGFEPVPPAPHRTTPQSTTDDVRPPVRTVRRRVRLTLEEAALGCVKVLRGKVTHGCVSCDGRGFRLLDSACGDCAGTGTVRQSAWYGWVSSMAPCGACHGERMARQSCPDCAGAGARTRSYKCAARIPSGVRHGDVLQVADKGVALEIQVALSPHALFVLDDDGLLRCEMPVEGFAWMANRWVDVPTLTGLQQMRLKRGHQVYRLRGQGFPSERRGARGDYVVTVVPDFPATLTEEQEALLDRLVATQAGALHAWQRALRAWDRSRTVKEAQAARGG
jgi:molecular chaperone DnaJ